MTEPAMTLHIDRPGARLELHVGVEVVGWIDYRPTSDGVILALTEVDPAHEGKGYGSELVTRAMEWFGAQGWSVTPMCPFAISHLRRHPELHGFVDPSMRSQLA